MALTAYMPFCVVWSWHLSQCATPTICSRFTGSFLISKPGPALTNLIALFLDYYSLERTHLLGFFCKAQTVRSGCPRLKPTAELCHNHMTWFQTLSFLESKMRSMTQTSVGYVSFTVGELKAPKDIGLLRSTWQRGHRTWHRPCSVRVTGIECDPKVEAGDAHWELWHMITCAAC